MREFFRRWRALSDWLAAWLAFGCALLSLLGGARLIATGQAVWAGWGFVAFGAGMIVALCVARRRGGHRPRQG
jgi:hypothetical protein